MKFKPLNLGDGILAKIVILLRNDGVVRYVVGVKDEHLANPQIDDVIYIDDMIKHVAVSSHHYVVGPPEKAAPNPFLWYEYGNEFLKTLPKWAVEKLQKFKLVDPGGRPLVNFVLCKAKSSKHNIQELEKRLTTALVSFDPRHTGIMVSWLPGSTLLCRRFRFSSNDVDKAVEFTQQLIELSKNIINTHADLYSLAVEYGKAAKPLNRWENWTSRKAYPLLPKGESL